MVQALVVCCYLVSGNSDNTIWLSLYYYSDLITSLWTVIKVYELHMIQGNIQFWVNTCSLTHVESDEHR